MREYYPAGRRLQDISMREHGKIRWKFRRKGAFEFVFFDSRNSSVEQRSRELIFIANLRLKSSRKRVFDRETVASEEYVQ
ncbi:hypothetical protein L1887_22892 [Cichorium endivia]|nr:hypothetical protein L1887_22892 [Cichorium endivia]